MPRATRKTSMWFDYPDDPDQGRVEISNLDAEDIAAINEASTTTRTAYDFEAMKPVKEQLYSNLKDRQETVARSVTDWENFYDQAGEEQPCSDKAKRAWACDDIFMAFVNSSRLLVEKAAAEARKQKTKNSSTIPAGSLE